MPVTPIFSEVIPNSTVQMTVTPDAADVNDPDTLFTNTGTESFTEMDIRVTRGGSVVDAVRDFDLDLKGTTEATFGVHIPPQSGDYEVRITHDRVHGLANDLVAYVRAAQRQYLWCTQPIIQAYLDAEGSIQIRDNDTIEADSVTKTFAKASAEVIENESVFEIATLISLGFSSDTTGATPQGTVDTSVYGPTPLGFKLALDTASPGTPVPSYLSILAAKLTASKIATVRLGASMSRLPNWVRVYKNEVYAQMQRWMLNAETAVLQGLTLRPNLDIADVLMKIKTREMTAEELER